MTRLIDADALRAWFSDHSVYDEFPVGYIMGLLDDQPTVEAIPIEWIHEYIETADLEYKRIALRGVLVQWQLETEEHETD